MILNGLLTKLIKKGHLVWIDHAGNELNYGDKSGECIKIKTSIPISGTKLILSPEIYIGELYMDGQLKVVDASIFDLLKLVFSNMTSENSHWILKLSRNISKMKSKYIQNNFIIKSKKNVAHHYDLSDRLYDLFLDEDRQYSCAYFKSTNDSLAKAQKNKKELIGKKLILKKNDKVLDIGSGWGGMAQYLAEKYKAKVKGITLSEEQIRYSNRRKKNNNLKNVKFKLQDYRNEKGSYDRIVSVGMFEHVGTPYYLEFFKKVYQLLNERGIALIHTIGRVDGPSVPDPWINKYIFPGGYIPSLSEIMINVENSGLVTNDIQVLKYHYAETLKRWRYNFYDNIEEIKEIYDDRFCRMWDFYLSSSQASFDSANLVVFQLQLSKNKNTVPDQRDYLFKNS